MALRGRRKAGTGRRTIYLLWIGIQQSQALPRSEFENLKIRGRIMVFHPCGQQEQRYRLSVAQVLAQCSEMPPVTPYIYIAGKSRTSARKRS
jgi:hypothetical protein